MTPTDIQAMVNNLAAILRKRKGLIKPEDFSANYQLAVDIQQQIAVHCKANNFPEKLMKAKAPNETSFELQYRKDIFEPITKPYWERALGSINRIWAEQNYSVSFNDPEVGAYFTRQYPIYKSILTYFKTVVTHYKINDPNAVIVIDAGEIPVVENEDGALVVDQTQELSPCCKIYSSDRVLYFDRDEYVLIASEDNSEVLYNDRKETTGLVFYLIDTNTIWKIFQTGKKVDYQFAVSPVYEHKLGYLPARRLGGKQLSESESDDIIYESYFQAAVPNLNKALKLDSTLDISINKMAYPVRVYYETPCPNAECVGGKVPAAYDPANVDAMQDVPTTAMLRDTCATCGGNGTIMGFSPARDYVHKPQTGNKIMEGTVPFPGFQYVSPDPAILDFNRDKITSDIEKAFMFLNIDVSIKGATGTNGTVDKGTATKAKIDREELFSFLLIISEELFGLLGFAIETIIDLRYPNSQILKLPNFQINPPMTFEIRSLSELTQEIQDAQTSNAPDAVLRELLKEYVALRFSTAKNLSALLDAVFYCDPLITKSTQDIVLLRSQGLVSPVDAVMHVHIFYFLEQKLAENPNYLDTKLPQILIDLRGMAKGKVEELGERAIGQSSS